MTQIDQELTIYQGETKTIRGKFLDKRSGNARPLLLTGALLTWVLTRVDKDTSAETVLVTKDNDDIGGITVTEDGTTPGARTSVVEVKLAKANTENLSPLDEYKHELGIVEVGGDDFVLFTGPVTINKSNTLV
jgi:hypothetical protein